MNAAEKIAHAAERKAFEAMLDSLIRKSQTKDVCTVANDFVNMVQKIHSSVWTPETFEMLHQIANDPDSKWAHYAERLLRECDPYLLRTFLTAAAYEGGFRGFQQARANSEKYDCNIPWIVLMDPTSACNMRCAGCWAAEYGHKQNLTFEEMDRVLTEGAELGTHACLFTGGEPLMRKADIFRLCEKLRDIAFGDFDASMISAAAEQGDPIALEAFRFTGEMLGRALADVVTVTSPEAIFLFGGLSKAGKLIFEPTQWYMEENMLFAFKNKVKLLPSGIQGKNAAILGASALIWQEEHK